MQGATLNFMFATTNHDLWKTATNTCFTSRRVRVTSKVVKMNTAGT
jgi:hypothetical protein